MTVRSAGRVFAIGLIALAASAPTARAVPQDTSTVVIEETLIDVQVREIAAQLRCVVCQGLSLQDSPSALAQEMRALIRERLELGETPEEVKEYFVRSYGEWILLEPEPSGFNLAIYVLPIAAVLAGGAFVAVAMRRWLRAPGADGAAPVAAPVEPDPELAPWD